MKQNENVISPSRPFCLIPVPPFHQQHQQQQPIYPPSVLFLLAFFFSDIFLPLHEQFLTLNVLYRFTVGSFLIK